MTVDLEFLIQKEGDFAWLPLESLTVEILVGRYQLIAQASEADCPIQVHIRHQFVQDGIWQEVVQEELMRTDSQGRIAVLPSTFLQHGRWIISCAPNEEKQLANSEIDRHCVQLQVLEQEIDLDQEWEFLDHPVNMLPELNLQGADLLSPLQAANITADTAWNNFDSEDRMSELEQILDDMVATPADAEEIRVASDPILDEAKEIRVASGPIPDDTAEIGIASNPTGSKPTPGQGDPTKLAPSLPQLPVIPKDVPPIRVQISPGLILPPALFQPDLEGDELPSPQLPVFPHLDHWDKLSYKELSIAIGRLYWSKLDTYGNTIDHDFKSLDLKERFLQTLNGLVLPETLDPSFSSTVTTLTDPPSPEIDTFAEVTAIVPVSTPGES